MMPRRRMVKPKKEVMMPRLLKMAISKVYISVGS